MLAIAASFDGAFWLLGGVELVSNGVKAERRYLCEAYRYEAPKGWTRIADLPRPIAAAPSPAPTTSAGFFVLGGDCGSHVGITLPNRHPGFRTEILYFDRRTENWTEVGILPKARVTVPLVDWNGRWVIPNGEVRPGIRSPQVWSVFTTAISPSRLTQ
jgi:hypothetical protein